MVEEGPKTEQSVVSYLVDGVDLVDGGERSSDTLLLGDLVLKGGNLAVAAGIQGIGDALMYVRRKLESNCM